MEPNKNLFIMGDSIQRVYRLVFDPVNKILSIELKNEVFEKIKNHLIEVIMSEFNFKKPWSLESSTRAGFEECFKVSQSGDFKVLSAKLTKNTHHQITTSLQVLFAAAQYSVPHVLAKHVSQEQSAFLTTVCTPGGSVYGHAMSGYTSTAFAKWFAEIEPDNAQKVMREVSDSIGIAYKALYGKKPKKGNTCMLHGSRFMLSNPSDIYSCQFGIMGDENVYASERWERGIKMNCHNLDFAKDQIIMICGFAKLCECFERTTAGM